MPRQGAASRCGQDRVLPSSLNALPVPPWAAGHLRSYSAGRRAPRGNPLPEVGFTPSDEPPEAAVTTIRGPFASRNGPSNADVWVIVPMHNEAPAVRNVLMVLRRFF